MANFVYENRLIGTLDEETKIFRKRVKKSKHLFRKFDAWGIQYDALCALAEAGCAEVRILDEDEQKVYAVPFATLYGQGVVEDFGFGRQVFLGRDQWEVTDYQPKQSPHETPQSVPQAVQGS